MRERGRELFYLLFGDMVIFLVSLWVTLLFRYIELPTFERLNLHLFPFLVLSGVWIFVFYIAGLYDKHTVFLKGLLFDRILNTQIANIIIAGLLFLIIPFGIAPKTNLVIYLFVSVALMALWRLHFYNYLSPKTRHKAVLLASGPEAVELVDEVNNNDRYNYSFVRIVDEDMAASTPNFESKLLSLITDENITVVIVDPRGKNIESSLPTIFDLAFLQFDITFLDFHRVYEDTFDRVAMSAVDYDWFVTHVSQSKSVVYDFTKKIIDIVGSLVLGTIFLLLLPFIALALKLEDKRSRVFIQQDRLGKFNCPMQVWKLRTMTKNDHLASTWTIEDSANKITLVGAFLRKTSLDEFPQILNILKGEMSLIGPRNDIVGLGARLAESIPYYNLRNFVRPGISGWAQTHQHYMGDNISPQSLEESRLRLAYDLYYVKHRSLMLDIAIALRTLKILLSRFGVNIRQHKQL
ncbi:hypothetical protein CL653_01225 [bacterium]|nr:hypothetical protein [bacterium]